MAYVGMAQPVFSIAVAMLWARHLLLLHSAVLGAAALASAATERRGYSADPAGDAADAPAVAAAGDVAANFAAGRVPVHCAVADVAAEIAVARPADGSAGDHCASPYTGVAVDFLISPH